MGGNRRGTGGGSGDEMKLERNAGLIMGTNSSSIVSKRSVERLYLPQPHFYRYFVRKPQRRSPVINRGYWLRMRAVEYTVREFLEKPSERQKVVINLGAGYDPLPFQWRAKEPSLCERVRFIDVDYEELLMSKCDIILATPKMKDLLTLDDLRPTEKGIVFHSDEYTAIGCDLRNTSRLGRLLNSVVPLEECVVLCVAEVSITYMPPDAADALLAWSSKLSSDVTFCLVEQRSPDRPDNPFTATMLAHFEKLGTPLRSILKYPASHAQIARFFAAGFQTVHAQSLFDFWSNPKYMSPSQRLALDQVEPFDEWEEFGLFASHYCHIVAHNVAVPVSQPVDPERLPRRDSCASLGSDLSTRTVSPMRHGNQWFAYRYCENPPGEGLTHHGSAYPPCTDDALALHGGVGPHKRLSTTFVYAPSHTKTASPMIAPESIPARCCHVMIQLGNGRNVLIGGRASPAQPMKDCYMQSDNAWERIHDLPKPRYRHRAAPVTLPDNQFGVVVFGGKNGPSEVDLDTIIWSPSVGWQKLKSLKQDPVPRFGMNFVTVGNNHGFMFGGMRQDGVICQGFWRWRLVIREGVVAGIAFRESMALDVSVGAYPWFARIGASYSIIRNEVLITGGIAKQGCIPKEYEILSISGSFSALAENEHEMDLKVASVEPILDSGPRPFMIGHSSNRTRTDQTLIMGGGATCFSFGSYWNRGVWLLYDRESGLSANWRLIETPTEYFKLMKTVQKHIITGKEKEILRKTPPSVPTLSNITTQDIHYIVESLSPRLLIDLPLGPCLSLWTNAYLKSKIPPTRKVVIHRSATSRMNFQRKDFSYTGISFHDFLDACTAGDHLYLRSLSSASPTSSPACFLADFPEIADDFKIPAPLNQITEPSMFHSSPFRISSNLNMWLHYDVMANFLFQVRGSKKLILFPPSDICRLDFPPGATSSRLDVAPDGSNIPNGTTPVLATLNPGDALFIPPLWSHAGSPISPQAERRKSTSSKVNRPPLGDSCPSSPLTPTPSPPRALPLNLNRKPLTQEEDLQSRDRTCTSEDPTSISINIFFRNLHPTLYAAGRDVYGNRDLAAYEDGRRDIDRMVKRFQKIIVTSSFTSSSPPTQSKMFPGELRNGDGSNGPKSTGGEQPQPGQTNSPPSQRPTHLQLSPSIPKELSKAYLERLANELLQRAAEL